MAYYRIADFRPCQSIGYLTKRGHQVARSLIEGRFRHLDISFSQWVSLALIREGLIDTSAGLASHLGHNSGATTRLVDALEERGFLTRERDAADRRIVRLSITPAAVGPIKELVRKVDTKEIGQAMADWLATPPPDLRAALQKWAEEREIEVE